MEFVDVNSGDLAAIYAVFHRYLFEYRGPFSLPLLFLVDGESSVRKVYANIPDRQTLAQDLLSDMASPKPRPLRTDCLSTPLV